MLNKPKHPRVLRFQRKLAQPLSSRKEMMDFLKSRLSQIFFSALPTIRFKVRKFMWNGKPVVIKDTLGFIDQGYQYDNTRKAILLHQRAVRSGKISARHYRIKTPKVYGRIGNYLVMEFMQGKNYDDNSGNLGMAYQELKENFKKLCIENLLTEPQLHDLIVLGNSNPGNPERGVWYFSLPYDFE